MSNAFQGSEYVDVLGTHGNPLSAWKVSGPLQKTYDRELRGSTFCSSAGHGSGARLHTPRDERAALGLTQPWLAVQLCMAQVRRGQHTCRSREGRNRFLGQTLVSCSHLVTKPHGMP